MSRQDQLNQINEERASSETEAQEERDSHITTVTYSPYVVSNEDKISAVMPSGISGSLTTLTDGTSYLIASGNIVINSQSNGAITISDNSSIPGWQIETYLVSDEKSRGSFDTYSISDNARKTLFSVTSTVNAIEPDGNGGVFIGGAFGSVQRMDRDYLAHIDNSGSVSSWDIAVNNSVYALKLSGSTLFVGGDFTKVGSKIDNAASIDLSTGEVENSFQLSAGGRIASVVESEDGSLFIGGNFTHVMNEPRIDLAKINPDGTLNTVFRADTNGAVAALVLSGSSTLFVGGSFSTLSGSTRLDLGAVDTTTGVVKAFAADTNGEVRALALSGSTLFVGGDFSTLSGSARSDLGAVDTTTGAVKAFAANTDIIVNALALSGSTLFVGGSFNTLSGSVRSDLGAVNTTTGAPTAFRADTNGYVTALALSGSTLFVGGDFSTLSGSARSDLGAVDTTTGAPTAFAANTNIGTVYALALSGSTLFAGGSFTALSGSTRFYLGAVDTTTGTPTSFKGDAGTSQGLCFITSKNKLIFSSILSPSAGSLTTFYFKDRNRIAAIDATYRKNKNSKIINSKNAILDWYPVGGADNRVAVLEVSGSYLYAGGSFTSMANDKVNNIRLSKINTSNAEIDSSWTFKGFNDNVTTLALGNNNKLYAGGYFKEIYTPVSYGALFLNENHIYKNIIANNTIYRAIYDNDNSIFIGGIFTSIQDQPRLGLAKLNPDGTLNTTFAADVSSSGLVNSLALSGSTLFVGGSFSSLSGSTRADLGAVDTTTGAVKAFRADTNGLVTALALSGSTLFVGGDFSTLSGSARSDLGAVDTTTGAVKAFAANTDGYVYALALSGSTLFIGGSFTTLSGSARTDLGAVNTTTGAPTAFAPFSDLNVYALALSGSTLFVGGDFTSMNGNSRYSLAAVNTTTGGLLSNFRSNTTLYSQVRALALSGSTLFAGGSFTTLSGSTKYRLAAVDSTTGQLTGSIEGTNGTVFALAVTGSNLFAGGGFTNLINHNLSSIDSSSNLSRLNSITGEKEYAININGPQGLYSDDTYIQKIKFLDNKLYVGGQFSSSLGTRNKGFAIIESPDSAAPTIYHIPATGSSRQVANFDIYNNKLYLSNYDLVSRGALFNTNALTSSFSGLQKQYGIENGTVWASAIDSNNSIFIGGNFTSIQNQVRRGLAKLNPDGTLNTAFAADVELPGFTPTVYTLALSGSTLFVGGAFSTLSGSARADLGSVDTTTGAVKAFGADTNGSIRALALSGSTLFVGGDFTTLSGSARTDLGSVDTTTGAVKAFAANANGYVSALALSGSTLFVGGNFNTLSGSSRASFGAVNTTTGTPTAFAADTNGTVSALALSGSTLFVGGSFSTLSGSSRTSFGAVNTTTGAPSALVSNLYTSSEFVSSLAVSGSTIFLAGAFTYSGGTTRYGISAINANTGTATSWNPNTNALYNYTFRNLSISGSNLFAGGEFTGLGARELNYDLSVIDLLNPNNPKVVLENDLSYKLSVLSTGNYFGEDNILLGGSNVINETILGATTLTSQALGTFVRSLLVENNMMKFIFSYRGVDTVTTARAGYGNYLINLPLGYVIDTDLVKIGSVSSYTTNFSDGDTLGVGTIRSDAAGSGGVWAVVPINPTQLVLVGKDPATAEVKTWGANASPYNTNNLNVSFVATIPVKINL
jgi:hypothetical protein